MILEGDKGVIDAIKEKKRLMDGGEEHGHIRPTLVVDGGLMKGSYGVGICLAFEELGFTKVFNSVVGISSGAPTAAYFVSGEVHSGASIVWDECCTRNFLNVWRFWNQVDTNYFISALRKGSGKALKTEKVFSNETKLYIGVANFNTGEPKLVRPTTSEEIFTSIQASILMPNVSNDIVHIDDIRYVDGGFTRPHILELVFDNIESTHILVITNQDHIGKIVPNLPWLERFLNHTLFRWRMPKALRFAAHERWKERMKAVKKMKQNHAVPCALVWGNKSIRSMERDSNKVKEVIEKSRLWWREVLS